MTDFFSKLPKWLGVPLVALLGGVIGWFANQFMEARSTYKEALTANYESFDAAAASLEQSLREFAEIAAGRKSKTPEAAVSLQTHLLDVLRVAKDLDRRLGHEVEVMRDFEAATIEVKHAADRLTGPIDAKPMVQAVSHYLAVETKLRDAVVNEHTAVLGRGLL